MKRRRGTGGDMVREGEEALAALLHPGDKAGIRMTPGGTVLRPGVPGRARDRSDGIAPTGLHPAAPAWLPWAGLFGGAAIGTGCILFGIGVAPHLAQAVRPAGEVSAAWIDALVTLAIFVPMLALALLAGAATRIAPLRPGRAPVAMLALGIATGACGIALAALYAAFAGIVRGGEAAASGGLAVLAGTVLMLLQSGTEEVLLRGWMQPAMASHWSPWAAVVLAALVFAGLHLLGGARSPVSLANLAIGGIMFGLLRWKTGGLVAPVAAHFAWNWVEALLLGLDPNPGVGSFGALVDFDMVGPAIWGGSDEGLNASLAMMVALIALVVPLALWKPRDE